MKRNYYLDAFRGFTIISMVIFHLMYNINFYWPIGWYNGTIINKIWQLSIAISFYVISGITANLVTSEKNIKRGLITSLIGFAISLITYLAAPDQFILWGVLNGLGASMIVTGLIQKKGSLKAKWAPIFLLLFIMTYKIQRGSLYHIGFFNKLYEKNLFFLGFPAPNFRSTDYFPMIPWTFIYIFGYLLGKYLISIDFKGKYGKKNLLAKIGQHSMAIYLAHQIILYPLVTLIYQLTT